MVYLDCVGVACGFDGPAVKFLQSRVRRVVRAAGVENVLNPTSINRIAATTFVAPPQSVMAEAEALTPAQAQQQIGFHAGDIARTWAWPLISQAASFLALDLLRSELAAGVAVDLRCAPGGQTPLQLLFNGLQNATIVYHRGGAAAFLAWAAAPPERRIEIDEGIDADRIACLSLLLERGASPNPAGNFPPLQSAAGYGSLAAVKMLLSAGSDANALFRFDPYQPHRVESALHMAVIFPRVKEGRHMAAIVDALLKAGADANPPEFNEKTLMQWAIGLGYRGYRHLWPVLLRGGAILPARENPDSYLPEGFPDWDTLRADPYLRKVEAVGGWKAYEKAHRAKFLAIFNPKFAHLVPPVLMPRIIEFAFHLGFY